MHMPLFPSLLVHTSWSTWSAVGNLRSRAGGDGPGRELRSAHPAGRRGVPPAARAAGYIERFNRVAHSSQPGAADLFCAPTAGDAVLPLS